MSCDIELFLRDEAATERLGVRLGKHLQPSQTLALVGELGAGKTCLTRGVAQGLAVDDPDEVCSPTYLLVVEHPGPVPLVHVDAYLADKTRDFLLDGGVDYLAEVPGVVVVEWADRITELLHPETLWVRLERAGGGRRVSIAAAETATSFDDIGAWITEP